jgi:hypothetical protein
MVVNGHEQLSNGVVTTNTDAQRLNGLLVNWTRSSFLALDLKEQIGIDLAVLNRVQGKNIKAESLLKARQFAIYGKNAKESSTVCVWSSDESARQIVDYITMIRRRPCSGRDAECPSLAKTTRQFGAGGSAGCRSPS